MENRYKVRMRLKRIDGGIPAHPNVVEVWLKRAGIQDDDELAKQIEEGTIKEAELEEKLAMLTTTFYRDDKAVCEGDDQPCIEARCIKAGIKQAAGVMGLYSMVSGLKELLKEGMEVYPALIPLVSKGKLQTETKAIHAEVQGRPINAFKRTRYLEDATIEFEVHITNRAAIKALFEASKKDKLKPTKKKAALDREGLENILKYGSKYTGWGANRSQGSGKAEVLEVVEITETS